MTAFLSMVKKPVLLCFISYMLQIDIFILYSKNELL